MDLSSQMHIAAGFGIPTDLTCANGIPYIAGDADQILRVFANLIRNACEACASNLRTGAAAKLRIAVRSAGATRVAVEFADNGCGMDDAGIAQLFVPFHTTKPGGTGLGLALAHRVIVAHGGAIRVISMPGEGAVFTIELPVQGESE